MFKILFLIILLFQYSFQYLVLNFKTNIDLNKLNEDNYMNTTMDQKIYVDLNIGDSNQIIPMTIKSQQLPTYIVSSSCTDDVSIKYDETKSSHSFHYIVNSIIENLYIYDFNEGYLVNDSITFNSSLLYTNFTYMLATKIHVYAKNISGEIGLSKKRNDVYPYYFPQKTQFLQQLKENNIIKNKIFGIVYDTEYEGRLIIGAFLDQVDDLYSEDDKITATIEDYTQDNNREKWLINFNVKLIERSDKQEEVYVEENTYGLVMYEIGLIVGSTTFRENFILNYFKERGCNETMVSSKPFGFYQYSCDNEDQFSDFPDIYLINTGKYMLNFTKEELFKKIGNKYIFQVVFEIISTNINYWRLGQAFFRKYQSFINWDEKESTFSYYLKKSEDDNSKKDKKKITLQVVLIIVLSIFLVLLIGLLIYFLIVCEKKRRRKRVTELQDSDDYDYVASKDINDSDKNMN